jgi:hypothetical protein
VITLSIELVAVSPLVVTVSVVPAALYEHRSTAVVVCMLIESVIGMIDNICGVVITTSMIGSKLEAVSWRQ